MIHLVIEKRKTETKMAKSSALTSFTKGVMNNETFPVVILIILCGILALAIGNITFKSVFWAIAGILILRLAYSRFRHSSPFEDVKEGRRKAEVVPQPKREIDDVI